MERGGNKGNIDRSSDRNKGNEEKREEEDVGRENNERRLRIKGSKKKREK